MMTFSAEDLDYYARQLDYDDRDVDHDAVVDMYDWGIAWGWTEEYTVAAVAHDYRISEEQVMALVQIRQEER